MSLWQNSTPILQAAIKTAGHINSLPEIVGLSTEPKIATLQQKGGNRSTFGIIKALLIAMNNNLHIDNSLTETNINNLAIYLTRNDEVRYWLTLADIDLLCRQIVQGRFGKFYNHFSESEFNDCLIKYCNERSELHRLQAEKANSKPDPEVLHEVGYSIGPNGQLIVPVAVQKKEFQQPDKVFSHYGPHGERVFKPNPLFHDPNDNSDLRDPMRIYRRAAVIHTERIQQKAIELLRERGIKYDPQKHYAELKAAMDEVEKEKLCPWPDALATAREEFEQEQKQKEQEQKDNQQ